MLLIGVDVGGTRLKLGIIRDNEIIKKVSVPTNTFDIIRQMANGIRELIQSIGLETGDIDGIGIGFPGMVVDSVVIDSPNIGLKNFNIKEFFESEFEKPVIVKNDAEMATLAEHKFGAGDDSDNMILITLGTGVGGGIIVNDTLYTGAGGAGEFGHMILEKNGRKCGCGRMGCAEQYISMVALDRLAKEMKIKYPNTIIREDNEGHISAQEIMRAFKRNDPCAIEVVNKYLQDFTSFLMDLCNIFRPNRIIVGGGITFAPELIEKAGKALKTLTQGFVNAPKVEVLPATLGNDAGILGAAVCFDGFEFKKVQVEDEHPQETENYADEEEFKVASDEDVESIGNLFMSSPESENNNSDGEAVVFQNVAEDGLGRIGDDEIQGYSVDSLGGLTDHNGEGVVSGDPFGETTFVQEGNDYVDPQFENVDDEFENYKPLDIGSDKVELNDQDLDELPTEEYFNNLYDVYTPGASPEITDTNGENDFNIINSMQNIGGLEEEDDLLEAEDGLVEDLENIEYSADLMARVNNLLKRK